MDTWSSVGRGHGIVFRGKVNKQQLALHDLGAREGLVCCLSRVTRHVPAGRPMTGTEIGSSVPVKPPKVKAKTGAPLNTMRPEGLAPTPFVITTPSDHKLKQPNEHQADPQQGAGLANELSTRGTNTICA